MNIINYTNDYDMNIVIGMGVTPYTIYRVGVYDNSAQSVLIIIIPKRLVKYIFNAVVYTSMFVCVAHACMCIYVCVSVRICV